MKLRFAWIIMLAAMPAMAEEALHIAFRDGSRFTLTPAGAGAFSNRAYQVDGPGMTPDSGLASITCSAPEYDMQHDTLTCAEQESPDDWLITHYRGSRNGLRVMKTETATANQ